MVDALLLAPETTRKLKRVEYDQLVKIGAFDDEQVELLEGEIVTMSPNYPEHASPVQFLNYMLLPALLGRALVRIQLPIYAVRESEPQPDVAIVPLGDYRQTHPTRRTV